MDSTIIPIPDRDIDREIIPTDELLCQACFKEKAITSCPRCRCPLCLDCFAKHIRKKKKKDLPN